MKMVTTSVTYYDNITHRNVTIIVTIPEVQGLTIASKRCISVAMATATETS